MIISVRLLARALASWRQRRDRLRRVRLDDFRNLSDRALADIGLRRADVQAAMIGLRPLGRRGAEPAPAICRLPVRPKLAPVANDLTDAA